MKPLTVHQVEQVIERRRLEAGINKHKFEKGDPLRMYWQGVEDQLGRLAGEIEVMIERAAK